jgi:putative endonuclease
MMATMYFVYIIRTLDDTLYIGVSESLGQRIDSHKSGKGAEWTKAHPGACYVYTERHATLGSARRREAQLKGWTRAKKEALIGGDLATLKNLSRCKSVMRGQ